MPPQLRQWCWNKMNHCELRTGAALNAWSDTHVKGAGMIVIYFMCANYVFCYHLFSAFMTERQYV